MRAEEGDETVTDYAKEAPKAEETVKEAVEAATERPAQSSEDSRPAAQR